MIMIGQFFVVGSPGQSLSSNVTGGRRKCVISFFYFVKLCPFSRKKAFFFFLDSTMSNLLLKYN